MKHPRTFNGKPWYQEVYPGLEDERLRSAAKSFDEGDYGRPLEEVLAELDKADHR